MPGQACRLEVRAVSRRQDQLTFEHAFKKSMLLATLQGWE